jgi:ring-1,2-phenylacetyl-CoA epoxidase subunit PaaD
MVTTPTEAQVWEALGEVMDPEIPVISVVDLGVIRSVAVVDGAVSIAMLPTFAGCPALDVMRAEVEARVRQLGVAHVAVRLVLSPPWSTDMISEAGREQLKAFGLAPPRPHGGLIELIFDEAAACPYCGSTDTSLKNSFGPTLCRAIYYCSSCQQPFEKIKGL